MSKPIGQAKLSQVSFFSPLAKKGLNAEETIRLAVARRNAMLRLHGDDLIPNSTGYNLEVFPYVGTERARFLPELAMTLCYKGPRKDPKKTGFHTDVFSVDYLGKLLPAEIIGFEASLVNYDIDWLKSVVRTFEVSEPNDLKNAIAETIRNFPGLKWTLLIHSSRLRKGGSGPIGIYLSNNDGSVCVKLVEIREFAWLLPEG